MRRRKSLKLRLDADDFDEDELRDLFEVSSEVELVSEDEDELLLDESESPKKARSLAIVRRPDAELSDDELDALELDEFDEALLVAALLNDARELRLLRVLARDPRLPLLFDERRALRRTIRCSLTKPSRSR